MCPVAMSYAESLGQRWKTHVIYVMYDLLLLLLGGRRGDLELLWEVRISTITDLLPRRQRLEVPGIKLVTYL
jgi:hypothetical protein